MPPWAEVSYVFSSNNDKLADDWSYKNVNPPQKKPYNECAVKWKATKNAEFVHVIPNEARELLFDPFVILSPDKILTDVELAKKVDQNLNCWKA